MRGILMIVVLCILGFLFLQLRCGIHIRYEAGNVMLWLRFGMLRILLFPRKPRNKKAKKPPKGKPKSEKTGSSQPKESPPVSKLLKEALPLLWETVGRCRRKLCIEQLTLRILWGADDPADAAIGYGATCAAVATILPQLERQFRVRQKEVHIALEYALDKPDIFLEARLSLRLGQLLHIGGSLGIRFLRLYQQEQKQMKQRRCNDGNQSSNQRNDGDDHPENS